MNSISYARALLKLVVKHLDAFGPLNRYLAGVGEPNYDSED